ncbi:MAG: cysteine desulfurase-like protein [Propionibacteriaceae bacterium]
MTFDVARVRADFPALTGDAAAHFDSPGGTQTPRPVIDAIAAAMAQPLSNRGRASVAQRNADDIVLGARSAMADLLNADSGGIIFGRSATSLTFEMSRTLATTHTWGPGDEILVSRLDHDANVRPWLLAAEACGATARFVDFDPVTGELAPEAVASRLTERTRLVAITAASNLIGTKPDIAAIAEVVHGAGVLLYVDGVHYAAHAHVDLVALGADFFVCSPYKFLGPHLGVLAAAPALLESLSPAKLLPSSNTVPERFELGTLPYEFLAGTTAAVDYLAAVAGTDGPRRDRLARSHAAVSEHESSLLRRLEAGLVDLGGVTRYSNARSRTSTLLFALEGLGSAEVADHLAHRGVNAPAGNFYAIETSKHLGLGSGGAVRAGLALYNTSDDVDRLLTGLAELTDARVGAEVAHGRSSQ